MDGRNPGTVAMQEGIRRFGIHHYSGRETLLDISLEFVLLRLEVRRQVSPPVNGLISLGLWMERA